MAGSPRCTEIFSRQQDTAGQMADQGRAVMTVVMEEVIFCLQLGSLQVLVAETVQLTVQEVSLVSAQHTGSHNAP